MFFKNLEKAIKKNNTNKSQIAQKLNISKSSFKKWEEGSSPKFETVIKIAEELNVSLEYLAYGEEKESRLEKLYNMATKDEQKIIDIMLEKYEKSGNIIKIQDWVRGNK